jgi:hypothetical protein
MSVLKDLTNGNSAIGTALVRNAGSLAKSAFLNLGNWRDDDAERYARAIIPAIEGIKLEAGKSTQAFYSAMAKINNEEFAQTPIRRQDVSTETIRNNVTAQELFRRPFVEMRTALAQGRSIKESIDLGAERASSLAQTEIQLARRNVGLQVRNANDRIVGYLRTLTGSENCALCFVASTQRYTRGDLLPIHPGCDCGEMPIYGTQDPGQVIDELRLDAIHDEVASRFGISDRSGRAIDYRKIAIRTDGELGPVLTVKSQDFTGPNELALVGKETKPSPNATKPDYYDLGLKTQKLDEFSTNPTAILAKTNPKYKIEKGYTNNCTNCVTAYDLRARGYSVSAKPMPRGRSMFDLMSQGYLNEDKTPIGYMALSNIEKRVPKNRITKVINDNEPVGARGFIDGMWGRTRSGHVWMWEKTESGVQYFDPQTNEVNPDTLTKNITRTRYIRVDNLIPNPNVINLVEDD